MVVAYFVNETNGRRYFLDRTMTIGAFGCNIELGESVNFIMRIYYIRNQNYVILYYNSNEFF